MKTQPRTWAKRMLLAELRELRLIGYACNVDRHWTVLAGADKERRAEAKRLLRIAIAAVRASHPKPKPQSSSGRSP